MLTNYTKRCSLSEHFWNKKMSDQKQGNYGKLKIHRESKWSQCLHVMEVISMIKMYTYRTPFVVQSGAGIDFCNELLGKISRSFTLVIRELPHDLRNCICVFYITLRALDTIEDDMHKSHFENINKEELLKSFYQYLQTSNIAKYKLDTIGEGYENKVLVNFDQVQSAFEELPLEYQMTISKMTQEMGIGMAEFSNRDMKQGLLTIREYNRYCYFVAGIVGVGLTEIFNASGREQVIKKEHRDYAKYKLDETTQDGNLIGYNTMVVGENGYSAMLSVEMGLFLQKVNIIRDFLEDYTDGRSFWPKEIWQKYASSLGDLAYSNDMQHVECLNDMVMDALSHMPNCIVYLKHLKDAKVFQFCATPQLMAIATLTTLYGNPNVFSGVVKIRKGLACQLMLEATCWSSVNNWYVHFLQDLTVKIGKHGKHRQHVDVLIDAAVESGLEWTCHRWSKWTPVVVLLVAWNVYLLYN